MFLRPADRDDSSLLLDALYEAFNWRGTDVFTREQLLADPQIGHYVAGWQRESDFGVIALGEHGAPLGVAWCRLFDQANAGYGFVSADVPELTMAVFRGSRGQGVGRRLLRSILTTAGDRGHINVSLSVEDDNVARRLYESEGFARVGRSGDSDTLVRGVS